MTENNNKPKSEVNLKIFFIKLISISVAIIIIINFLFNIILAERLEKIDKILSVSESTKRYELKEKIRDEINQGLDKKNMLHEEDKILLYKLYLKIKKEFPQFISEVRGRGLFIGIDLIKNGNNLLPNKYLASDLVNNLRNKGILLSLDGPHHNVIKIKPPLPFNKNDVDFVCYEINDYLLHK